MKSPLRYISLCMPALLILGLILGSCNSKKEDEPEYTPAMSVAINSFVLRSNSKVMKNLDSVFFSVDLDHAIVFNADSLPAGTKVDKLVADIKFPSTVTSAIIRMTGGATRTGQIDYLTASGDSIDFTGNVTLTLSTDDDALTRTYTLKVNVHRQVPDSLMWDRAALSALPSRMGNPEEQRTVSFGDKVVTLIKEADGSYTLARCTNPADDDWTRTALSLTFTPDIRSLAATDDALYILSSDGALHTSSDGLSWTPAGVSWKTVIGGFGASLLGISESADRFYHDIYPRPDGFTPTELEEDFPIEGMSEFHSFTSPWAADPIGFFVGGRTYSRSLSDATWAYDGFSWARISHKPLPPLESPLILPYYMYRQTATSWIQTEFNVTLCIGGRLTDGKINPTVYYSYDNGVNWAKGDTLIQLPSYLAPTYEADAVIRLTPMDANLGANWTSKASMRPSAPVARIKYFVEGTDISWECPYIYMMGGRDADDVLSDRIWRAVLARLTFAPIF